MMQQAPAPSAQAPEAAASSPEAATHAGAHAAAHAGAEAAAALEAEKDSPKASPQTRVDRYKYVIELEDYYEERNINDTSVDGELSIREERIDIIKTIRRPRAGRREADYQPNLDMYAGRPGPDQGWSDFNFSPLAISAAVGSGLLRAAGGLLGNSTELDAKKLKEKEPKRVEVARSKKELESLLERGIERDQIVVTKLEDEIEQKIQEAIKQPATPRQANEQARGIEAPQAQDLAGFSLPLRNEISIPEFRALKDGRAQSEPNDVAEKVPASTSKDQTVSDLLKEKLTQARAITEAQPLPIPERQKIEIPRAMHEQVQAEPFVHEDFHLVSIPWKRDWSLRSPRPEPKQNIEAPVLHDTKKETEKSVLIPAHEKIAIETRLPGIKAEAPQPKERVKFPDFRLKARDAETLPHQEILITEEPLALPERHMPGLKTSEDRDHYLEILRKIKASFISDIRASKDPNQAPRKSAQPFLKLLVEQERSLALVEN